MKRAALFVSLAAAALTLGACRSGAAASGAPTQHPAGQHAPASHRATVKVTWQKIGQDEFGRKEVRYVVHVTNTSGSAEAVRFTAKALDSHGSIVGSNHPLTPRIAAHAHLDFVGSLGGASFESLSAKPSKLEVSLAGPSDNSVSPLKTRGQKFTRSHPAVNMTKQPYVYDLHVTVANDADKAVSGEVRQQVILRDSSGKIVTAYHGASDDAPETLAPGASYVEHWSGIGSPAQADSVDYAVWPTH